MSFDPGDCPNPLVIRFDDHSFYACRCAEAKHGTWTATAPAIAPAANSAEYVKAKYGDASKPEPPPAHYQGKGGMEPWQVVEAFDLDYWTGSVVKYVCRAGKKDDRLADLRKAANFIAKAIELEQKK